MKEREKERAEKLDQAMVEGKPSDGGKLGTIRRRQIVGAMQRLILCVWSKDNLFPLGLESEEG